MPIRHWLPLVVLAFVAGCSDDETNSPPRIAISAPADGAHLVAATQITADTQDDEWVDRVRFEIDGELIAEVTEAPWEAALPVGRWAHGRPVTLTATAWDGDDASAAATPITVTIDPDLQTVPQITELAAQDGTSPASLRASWLAFPDAARYELQIARSGGFAAPAFAQTLDGITALTPLVASGVWYARVRADTVFGYSHWSRVERFSHVTPALVAVPLPGNQVATLVVPVADGSSRILSRPLATFAPAGTTTELITVGASGTLLGRAELLPAGTPVAAQLAAADGLVLATGAEVRRFALATGALSWSRAPASLTPTALGSAAGAILVAGRDHVQDAVPSIAVVTLSEGGDELGRDTIDLPGDHAVAAVWGHAGGHLLAGELLAEDGTAAGVWVHRYDGAGAELWRVRLGTTDLFSLRAAAAGEDDVVLAGAASAGGAWVASVTLAGDLRWLTRETGWTEIASVSPAADGRWLAAGRAGETLAFGELGEGGGWRWQQTSALGSASRGLAIARADDGSVVVTGATTAGSDHWNVLFVRSDDLGVLAP